VEIRRNKSQGLAAIGFLALVFGASSGSAEQECLQQAWKAFNDGNAAGAIVAADKCIDDFGPKAEKEQAALAASSVPLAPTGTVDNPAERNAIFARWAVNDISAAYFVKGRAAERLYQAGERRYKAIAEQAYQGAIRLSYGRVWDPKGWFWSPKEASEERLPLR
jgi:hypothetical protein